MRGRGLNEFLDSSLALIEASWAAALSVGHLPWPTVYVNRGAEGSYEAPAHLLLPDGIHPFIAAAIRESGATEAVFSSGYKFRGRFGRQKAIASLMTTEGVESYMARVGKEGLQGWRVDRAASRPWGEGFSVFTQVREALRENALSLSG